ncbi:uncharacterized protein [Bemisia tabaci]|uniref:uncharacterized protein n=1 Tax=Bemisia tabaci TaxID=7038 RepID=UPI003B2850B9
MICDAIEVTDTVKPISYVTKQLIDKLKTKYSLDQLQLSPNETLSCPPWMYNIDTVNLDLAAYQKGNTSSTFYKERLNQLLCQNFLDYKQIYTDGSKQETSVGLAFVDTSNNFILKQKLSPLNSIFTAEMLAILEAIRYVQELSSCNNDTINYVICSDSLSSLRTLKYNPTNHPFSMLIHDTVHSLLANGHSTSFIWVPAHIGVLRNETADRAATEACSLQNITHHPFTQQDAKKAMCELITKSWEQEWSTSEQNRLRRAPMPYPRTSNHKSRSCEVQIARLRIGHTFFTHNYIISKENQPTCHFCNSSPLTIKHILMDCSSLRHLQPQIYSPTINRNTNPLTCDEPNIATKILKLFTSLNLKI